MDAPGTQYDLFEPTRDPVPPREPEAAPEACYWDYCPNCGEHLQNVGCKYRCPRCHYFMSCSDFD